jgi:deoxyribose-phosphate aldolase
MVVSSVSSAELAAMIDHTLLKPEATAADVQKLCAEAREHNFASVCINGIFVPQAAELLQGSRVNPIAVVGFPLGACSSLVRGAVAGEGDL